MDLKNHVELISLVKAFLNDVNDPLKRKRVIPPSSYRTYLKVGKDYEGFYIMGLESYRNLENSIKRFFPEVFTEPEKLLYWKHPSMYIFNLLSRAIKLTDWENNQSIASDELSETLVENLIRTIESPTTTLYKCREVSHLTTENLQVLTISNLEIRPTMDQGHSRDSMQWVAKEIPGAFVDWDERVSLSIERPLTLVTHKVEGSWELIDEHYSERSQSINEFILACRLIYNATIRNYWEVVGSPDPLSPYRSFHINFEDFDGLISLIQKDAVIKADHVPGVEWLIAEINFTFSKPESQSATPLEIGLSNFTKSFYSGKSIRAIADLATCLESIILQDSRNEVGLKLRSRTAALIYTDTDSIQKLYLDLKALYELRSILVHGGSVDEVGLLKILNKIVPRQDISTNEKLALAVSRFQDIVRRALLTRLTLERTGQSPWLDENIGQIDALLADSIFREECRKTVKEKLQEVGLDFVIEDSKPAKVTFVDQGYLS